MDTTNKTKYIFLDTSTILDFYQFSGEYLVDLVKYAKDLISLLNIEIYITEQIYREYYNNRLRCINDRIQALEDYKGLYNKEFNIGITTEKLENDFKLKYADEIFYNNDDLEERFKNFIEDLQKINTKKNSLLGALKTNTNHEINRLKTYIENLDNDPIVQFIENLNNNEYIYGDYNLDKYNNWISEAERLAAYTILPGFKDNNKKTNYLGDFINYKLIIEFAKDRNSDIIFITEDNKEKFFSTNYHFEQITKQNFQVYDLKYLIDNINDYVDNRSFKDYGEKTIKHIKNLQHSDNQKIKNILNYNKLLEMHNIAKSMDVPKQMKFDFIRDLDPQIYLDDLMPGAEDIYFKTTIINSDENNG